MSAITHQGPSDVPVSAEHHATRKASLITFVGLVVLTVTEVLLAMTRIEGSALYNPQMSRDQVFWGLIFLAAGNGFLVIFYFMNLRFESKTMKKMVFAPLAFPVLYALVLIAEAIWRRQW
jgi:heme/copper-type cytochrome/quinol oxidase subunit 4